MIGPAGFMAAPKLQERPSDYIEIKAEVFRIIRANSECKSIKKIMKAIKRNLPDVSPEVIRECLYDLYTQK